MLALGDAGEARAHVRLSLELLAGAAGAAVSGKPTQYVRAALLLASGVRALSVFPLVLRRLQLFLSALLLVIKVFMQCNAQGVVPARRLTQG